MRIAKSPIFWGFAGTFFYFAAFLLFLVVFGKQPWKNLDLNEIGDFFAGAFAPLAFVWLVVAIFLQKQELSAQRAQLERQMEELQLSREELRLNRMSLKEQGIELKRQSESLAKQNEALEEEAFLRRTEAELEVFAREFIKVLQKFVYNPTLRNNVFSYDGNSTKAMLANDQFAEAFRDLSTRMSQLKRPDIQATADVSNFLKRMSSIKRSIDARELVDERFKAFELENFLEGLEFLQKLHVKHSGETGT